VTSSLPGTLHLSRRRVNNFVPAAPGAISLSVAESAYGSRRQPRWRRGWSLTRLPYALSAARDEFGGWLAILAPGCADST
jgi:hypothetical protein